MPENNKKDQPKPAKREVTRQSRPNVIKEGQKKPKFVERPAPISTTQQQTPPPPKEQKNG